MDLLEVELDVITIAACETLANLPPDSSKVLCALTDNKDTCQVNNILDLTYRIFD